MSTQSETIQVTGLPTGTKDAIEEIARDAGKSGEEYLRTVIQAEILSHQPFDEILAPIRESFKASGMTEDELDALVEETREKVHQEQDK